LEAPSGFGGHSLANFQRLNVISVFRRSTSSTSFIAEMDGLRFFAIFTVLLYHMNTAYVKQLGMNLTDWKDAVGSDAIFQIGWWFIRLDVGVKVFFAISGFILSLPFFKAYLFDGKKVNLKEYFIRRLIRLEPPFIITLIGFYFVHVFVLNANAFKLLPHFFAGLIYSHVLIFGRGNPINPVTWSLETEAQFYLILPFLFFVFFNIKTNLGRAIFSIVLILLSIYAKHYFYHHGIGHFSSTIVAYFTNFAVGIFFAYLYLKKVSYFKKDRNIFFDLIAVFSVFIMFWFYKPQAAWYNNVLLNLSILGLFVSAFKGTISNWFYTRPFIFLIGGMCYSIYLLHFALFFFLVKYTGLISVGQGYWLDFFIQFLILFPSVILVSAVFYLSIEKPFMDKKWIHKRV
jgi:peptidoglycan/LPS O-acetylase OafA/YrhL